MYRKMNANNASDSHLIKFEMINVASTWLIFDLSTHSYFISPASVA